MSSQASGSLRRARSETGCWRRRDEATRWVLHLYRVRVRSRFVQEALAVIGIAVGVALLFASQVANTSLNGSVEQLTSWLVGHSRLLDRGA